MPWTDERKELVRKLWAEGLSAADIAERLGSETSRNAVIGIICRNGWQRGQIVRVFTPDKIAELRKLDIAGYTTVQIADRLDLTTSQVSKKLFRLRRQISERRNGVKVIPLLRRDAPKPKPNLPPVGAKAIRLLDLLPNNCRWPLGAYDDPPEFFCGAEASGSYCPYHQDVACGRVSGGMTLPQPERSKRRVGNVIFTKGVA